MTNQSARIILFALILVFASGMGGQPVSTADAAVPRGERVIVIGDVHGDYGQLVKILKATGLVNRRNKWTGGNSQLVQLGDIVDRGPSSRAAMDLLIRLERQAAKKGGAVHALIGNHESMMMQTDLRYVHPGEYESFRSKNSKKLQQKYYELPVDHYKKIKPEEEWPLFDDAYRANWFKSYPLGYVEHRQAWAPTGDYGRWALSRQAVLKLNRTLFVHGGISESVLPMSIAEINTRIRTELVTPDKLDDDALVNTPDGPLWYRGLAVLPETPENDAMIDRILQSYDVDRIVIAHTPLLRAVVPRFSGKVLLADVGLSSYYGSGMAYVIIENDIASIIHRGKRFAVPSNKDELLAYLQQIAALEQDKDAIEKYRQQIMAPVPVEIPIVEEAMDE